jgi:beta-mannosidase
VPGPASAETLRKIIPADELWPRSGTQWETRHALKAWQPDSWLDLPTIEHYFGPQPDLEVLVANAQWLQCEGLKAIFEEARRQKPACAMALNWCFNEPWPTAANNSLVTWPSEPKRALAAVAQSCRPVLASARIPKFSWRTGEMFSVQLFMLNDSPEPLEPGCVDAWLEIGGQRLAIGDWQFEGGATNTNIAGPTMQVVLPQVEAGRLTLVLQVDGKPEWNSRYDLLIRD